MGESLGRKMLVQLEKSDYLQPDGRSLGECRLTYHMKAESYISEVVEEKMQ